MWCYWGHFRQMLSRRATQFDSSLKSYVLALPLPSVVSSQSSWAAEMFRCLWSADGTASQDRLQGGSCTPSHMTPCRCWPHPLLQDQCLVDLRLYIFNLSVIHENTFLVSEPSCVILIYSFIYLDLDGGVRGSFRVQIHHTI